MNKSNITRNNYKMFCLIVKDFWFKKDIEGLLDIVAQLCYLEEKCREVWDLYKIQSVVKKLERNQFAVLTIICKGNTFAQIKKEIWVICSRYKKSYQYKKNQFLDD